MGNIRKYVLFFSQLILVFGTLFSFDFKAKDKVNYFPPPIMEFPDSVSHVKWTEGTDFIVSYKHFIYKSHIEDPEKISTLPVPEPWKSFENGIQYLETVTKSSIFKNQVMAFPYSNEIQVFDLNSEESITPKLYSDTEKINKIAISPNGLYIATAMESGELNILLQLLYTKKLNKQVYKIGDVPLTDVSFSHDSQLLSIRDKKGNIQIWNLAEGVPIGNFKYPAGSGNILFTKDNNNIMISESGKSITILDFQGNIQKTISITFPVSEISLAKDMTTLITKSTNNSLYLYDLEENRYIGFIPSLRKTELTSYDFNSDETLLLLSYDDGSIYMVKTEDFFLSPDATFTSSSDGGGMGGFGGGMGYSRKEDSFEFRGNVTFGKPSFTVGAGFSFGYTNAKLINPIYFGILIQPVVFFPDQNNPYIHFDSYNRKLEPPFFIQCNFLVPIGIAIVPFSKDLELFAELTAGLAIHTLYSKDFSTGKIYPSFIGGIKTGAAWKRISLTIGIDYDVIDGVLFNAGLGYRLALIKH